MSSLADCLGKAVKGGLMTEEEAAFALGRSKDFQGQGQDRKTAEFSTARSLMTDALKDLDEIRVQLGFAPREDSIVFRTKNEEAANNAYVEASQKATEQALIRQKQGADVVEQAQVEAEEAMAGPRPGTAEALQFAPAAVTSPEREQSIRSLEQSLGLPAGSIQEVNLRDAESPATQATTDFAAAWQNLTGREVVFVDQPMGEATFAGAVDPTQPGKIFLHARGNRALVALAGHEWLHTLAQTNPALFAELTAKLRPLIAEWQQRTGQLAQEGYVAEEADEELVANIVGDSFNNPEFWELVKERDRSLWQRIVEAINNWFDELIGAAAASEWGTENFISDLRAVHEAVLDTVDAAGEVERPGAAEVTTGKLATQRGKGAAKELSAEHAMKNERQTRAVALKTQVSNTEKEAITASLTGPKIGATGKLLATYQEQAEADARGQRKKFPANKPAYQGDPGWMQPKVTGAKLEVPKNEKGKREGAPKAVAKWAGAPYDFHKVPEGMTKEAYVRQLAEQSAREMIQIAKDALAGDINAQVIMNQRGWYRNFATKLRREFGGFSDLMADLLGTFSPGTNVHVNWIFAMDAIHQIQLGRWDAELAQLDAWIQNGGTADSYKKAEMPLALQANGKKYGFNSEKGMLAALDLWRAVKKGDAVKARNFSRNLVQISLDATIDRWAARHVQRLANRPRPPLYSEGAVDGVYAESLQATGQFRFAQEVMAESVRILQELDPAQFADLTPADYQAMQWFAEKRQWTIYNWTSEEGEGGSFESKLKKENVQRMVVGLSQQIGRRKFVPTPAEQQAFTEGLQAGLLRIPETLTARSKPTVGMFMGKREESTDTEVLVGPDFDPMEGVELIAFHAGQKKQQSTFLARILDPMEDNANATPGIEIYFKQPVSTERLNEVMGYLKAQGLDGFTMVIDPRERVSSEARPTRFRGIRLQYIPEFAGDGNQWTQRADEIEDAMILVEKMVSQQEDIVSAQTLLYDNLVLNYGADYDTGGLLEASGGKERAIAWSGRFRYQAAARATSGRAGGPAVSLPPVYRRGAVVRGGTARAKLAQQRAAPRRGVEREAEVTAAIERITRRPTERVAALQEMQGRLTEIIRRNRLEIAGLEFARGMTVPERAAAGGIQRPEPHQIEREKMLAAMGELNAMLRFLPPEIRGKVGGHFSLAKGGTGELRLTDFLTHRVEMIGRELERMLQRDYRSQITSMLERTKPKQPGRVLISKIGPDAQKFVDQVRAISSLSHDESAAAQAKISHELEDTSKLTPERAAELEREWMIHDQFSDLAHRSAEELESAYETLSDVVQRGRFQHGVQEELRLEQQRANAAELTAAMGVPSRVERRAAREGDVKVTTMAKHIGLSHYNMFQFLQSLLPEGTSFLKGWEQRVRRADNGSQDMMRKSETRMIQTIQKAVGSETKSATSKAIEGLKTKIATPFGLMSQLEIIQDLLSWAQPEVRARMEANEGWDDAKAAIMEDLVKDEVSQAMMGFLRKEYDDFYKLLDPVYQRMFGMHMPRIRNYAPTRYHNAGKEDEISPYGSAFSASGTLPTFVHPRISHSAQMKVEDALLVYRQHVAQAAHWIQFAELLREMRGVLSNSDVRGGIELHAGQGAVSQLNQWMDLMAKQGHEKANELVVYQRVWNALFSAKAIASLGFNIRSLMMQVDSMFRATMVLPTDRILAAMADPNFAENIRKSWNSDTIQRRIEQGSSAQVKYIFDQHQIRPNAMLGLAKASMMPIQWTDAGFTSFTAAIIYTDAFNEGKAMGMSDAGAEAYAADKMDDGVYRIAQPTGTFNRSLVELTGQTWARMFMMFLSDQRMKSAFFFKAIEDFSNGRIEASTFVRGIMSIFTLAIVSKVMENLYSDVFTPEEEKKLWTWQGFVESLMTVPFSGFAVFGTGMEAVAGYVTGQKVWKPDRDPIMSATGRAEKALKNWEDLFDPGDTDKFIRELDNIFRTTALAGPATAVPATLLNMIKPWVGAYSNAIKEEEKP